MTNSEKSRAIEIVIRSGGEPVDAYEILLAATITMAGVGMTEEIFLKDCKHAWQHWARRVTKEGKTT